MDKKIVSKYFILCLVFAISNGGISGQETLSYLERNPMYVISGDGLKLRSEPTTQSRIIRVLPFLTRVEIIDKNDSLFVIDGISSYWYKVRNDNDIGWVFGGYLSNDIDIPKVENKKFIAVYRIKNIDISVESFGFENILKRLKKSYLVIYETTGNKRYIYDDEGLIEMVPRFGDGIRGSDIIVSGIYKHPWMPIDDNRELTEIILITFQSRRNNTNNEAIYNYNITIIYEQIDKDL